MSRKTDEIKKSLENLASIQQKLENHLSNQYNSELEFVCEEMKSELNNLKLWITMLYKYNGTSKSKAKVNASRENGKKGGRPPKYITDLKKRRKELEDLIEDLHKENVRSIINDDEKIRTKEKQYIQEIENINLKLSEYHK